MDTKPTNPKQTILLFSAIIIEVTCRILLIIILCLTLYTKKTPTQNITTYNSPQVGSIKEDVAEENKEKKEEATNSTEPTDKPSANEQKKQTENPIYCGVEKMPENVCLAVLSIEKDGIVNNPYVTADTSQIPEDINIDIEEQSWSQGAPKFGSLNFKASYDSQTLTGIMYFQNGSAGWKVVDYSLSNE